MKISKRIMGIVLTLALILQCGQGIVISKAEAVSVTPSSNNPNLTMTDLDCSIVGGNYVYSFNVSNNGTTAISQYKAIIQYTQWGNTQPALVYTGVSLAAGATVPLSLPTPINSGISTASAGIYECKSDARISNPNYATSPWGDATLSFSIASTIARCSYKFTFINNDGALQEKTGVANGSNVSIKLTQGEKLNNGTLLSYEITGTYGATEYTAKPVGVTVSSANLPTVDLAPYNGGPFITPNAGGVGATDTLKYTVSYVDGEGPKTATFVASGSGGKFKMSDASWYNDNIIITKWEITELVKLTSDYSWMKLALTADGSSWTVTNTSSNDVTQYVVNSTTYDGPLGLNQTSTPVALPAAVNNTVEVHLTDAKYVSIGAMYPDVNAIWFVPTTAQMSKTGTGSYRIEWAVANTSTDYRVNSFNLSFHYKINGQDKYQTLTISDAVEAQGTKSNGYVIGTTDGSFEIVDLTIQNVSYTKDVDPALEHTGISGPTVATSSLNYKTYVTWSLVNFGTYALQADGGTGPIEWRVLEYDKDNDLIVLMANKALFSMAYEPTMFGATWESSTLRNYLNKDFMNDAFDAKQQDTILQVTLDNSGSGSSHSSGGASTTDKVYVLSVNEMNNQKYGLYGGDTTNSVIETRQFEATEATLANKNLTKKKYAGQTFVNYFLRTPGYYQYDVAGVAPNGLLSTSGWRTYTKTAAVCPVIQVRYSAAVAMGGLTWKGSVYKQVPSGYNTAAAKSVKATPTKKLKALSVGDTKTVDSVTYEVTETTNKSKTVAVAGVKKSAKQVVIPSTIKVNGATYKVTKIKANAFKNAKSKLKSITIKSKHIKTMNKKAFDGLTDKTTVKISKGQYKKYKKLIKNNKLKVKKLS